ncbi:hypothetical protein COCNU_12G005090 [Cocos nucifera]|uniref:dihydropyrimidinase n=1 Tax=Cocos nucifera TaxID=13894 RepID=A0A8K0NA08_COCNU|nr:hypothetical protein COCNU_12G005090 [Cocos nucifera]
MQGSLEASSGCLRTKAFYLNSHESGSNAFERFPEPKKEMNINPGGSVESGNPSKRESSAPPTQAYSRPFYQQDWPNFHPDVQNIWQSPVNIVETHFYPVNREYAFPVENKFHYPPFRMFAHGYPHEFQFQEFQYFVVIDFEATCDKEKNLHPQEIIEFPSVLVNSATGQLEASFQTYVRPLYHQCLSNYCKELTGIQQIQIKRRIESSLDPNALTLKDFCYHHTTIWRWIRGHNAKLQYVMSPPIRKAEHGKALRAALSTGTLQLVGTDHCALNSTQKALGIDDFRKIPNGVNGIEERMHLVWDTMVASGQISVTDYVRITSTECARIFNIYPRKGAILEGSDADIIILNPNATFKITAASHHSRSDMNVFEGMTGKGEVEVTISGGRVAWENNKLNIMPGSGRYIRMPPYGYLFDGIDKADAAYLASLHAPVHRTKAAA